MKMKRGVLQVGPMVRRIIYLSRDANKALNNLVKTCPFGYTPGEQVELLILEEAEKVEKIRAAVKEISAIQKAPK